MLDATPTRPDPAAYAATRRAVLAVAAPALVVAAPGAYGPTMLVPVGAAAVLLGVVGLRAERSAVGRMLATVVWVLAASWTVANRLDRPAAVLAISLAVLAVLGWIWPSRALVALDAERADPSGLAALRAACVAALVALGLAWVFDVGGAGVLRSAALAAVAWVPAWFAPIRGSGLVLPRVLGWGLPVLLLAASLAAGGEAPDPWFLAVGPVALLVGLSAEAGRVETEPRGALEALLGNPTLALVGSFAVACLLGTALLTLPGVTREPIALLDAAFTAVSATCVTGLAVLDTSGDFTWFGQALILLLIQVGGLGIMTLSAATFALLGRRMSVLHETAAAELMGAEALSDVVTTVRRIFVVTAVTEGIAALLLLPLFVLHGDSWLVAAWRAAFTAISAFCNAGFALQSDSLVPYQDDPLVLLVVAGAILVGGLGPPVVAAIPAWARREPVSLHVRLVLVSTVVFVVAPALLIGAIEWTNTLDGMTPIQRLVNALFQSVTLRTAGFHSIDLTEIRPATWTVMILGMFVGGSPGSTAGGIKTTTFAIVAVAVWSAIRGRHHVRAYGRRIPDRTVYQAASIAVVGVASAILALFVLQLTHDMPLHVAFFEVVSALATVGLSVGGTAELDAVGKVLVIFCMFAGRVGPVTLFALLSGVDERSRMQYPEARVPVG